MSAAHSEYSQKLHAGKRLIERQKSEYQKYLDRENPLARALAAQALAIESYLEQAEKEGQWDELFFKSQFDHFVLLGEVYNSVLKNPSPTPEQRQLLKFFLLQSEERQRLVPFQNLNYLADYDQKLSGQVDLWNEAFLQDGSHLVNQLASPVQPSKELAELMIRSSVDEYAVESWIARSHNTENNKSLLLSSYKNVSHHHARTRAQDFNPAVRPLDNPALLLRQYSTLLSGLRLTQNRLSQMHWGGEKASFKMDLLCQSLESALREGNLSPAHLKSVSDAFLMHAEKHQNRFWPRKKTTTLKMAESVIESTRAISQPESQRAFHENDNLMINMVLAKAADPNNQTVIESASRASSVTPIWQMDSVGNSSPLAENGPVNF